MFVRPRKKAAFRFRIYNPCFILLVFEVKRIVEKNFQENYIYFEKKLLTLVLIIETNKIFGHKQFWYYWFDVIIVKESLFRFVISI